MKRGVIIYSVSAIKVWVYAVLVSQSVRIFVDLFFFLVICMSGTSDPPPAWQFSADGHYRQGA